MKMKKETIVLRGLFIFGLAFVLLGGITFADAKNKKLNYKEGEVLVKYKENIDGVPNLNEIMDGLAVDRVGLSGYTVVKVPKGKSVEEVVKKLSKDKRVKYAQPNYKGELAWTPNDPYFHLQWNFDKNHVNMPAAWGKTRGKSSIKVAVVDTGVAYENYGIYKKAPDLNKTKFIDPYDAVDFDGHANDDCGHGTHVTGTIAQSTNNLRGTAGIAPNTTIMPIDVFVSDCGGTFVSYVVDGITWAINHGAKVITMSLEFQDSVPLVHDAIKSAVNHGIVVTVATGNGKRTYPDGDGIDGTGDPSLAYPAAYKESFAVGATEYLDQRAYYSNYGKNLDIMAPGGDTSADHNGDGYVDGILQQTYKYPSYSYTSFDYQWWQGTSMATPHVAGAAALLFAQGRSASQVKKALLTTAYKKMSGYSTRQFGAGRLDVAKALNYAFCTKSKLKSYQAKYNNYKSLTSKYKKLYKKYKKSSSKYKKYYKSYTKYLALKNKWSKNVKTCKKNL